MQRIRVHAFSVSIDGFGGTTFHFVTERMHAAHQRALGAAGNRDVRVGGGVATIRQYLRAGESLLAGIDLVAMGLERTEYAATANALHVVLARRGTVTWTGGEPFPGKSVELPQVRRHVEERCKTPEFGRLAPQCTNSH